MIAFDAGLFADVMHDLSTIQGVLASPGAWMDDPTNRSYYGEKLERLVAELAQMGLTVSKKKAHHLQIMISKTVNSFTNEGACQAVKRNIDGLRENLMYELEGRKFFGPIDTYSKYYDQIQLFGKEVFDKFSSANEDIYEAGMCLSLERGTACVMHLMRVLEVGLLVLAKTVGVENKNDWGTYLRGIETALDKLAKDAGARSADEQFYAEAAADFNRVRLAFRNPTMHVGASYSPERAEDILLASKAFMAHLATRLSEAPWPSYTFSKSFGSLLVPTSSPKGPTLSTRADV